MDPRKEAVNALIMEFNNLRDHTSDRGVYGKLCGIVMAIGETKTPEAVKMLIELVKRERESSSLTLYNTLYNAAVAALGRAGSPPQ